MFPIFHTILAMAVTVIFSNLFALVYRRGDSPFDLIPFVRSYQYGTLDTYDFYFVIFFLICVWFAKQLGITFRSLHYIFGTELRSCPYDYLIMFASGLATHYLLWPVLATFLHTPFSMLGNSSAPLRNISTLALTTSWFFLMILIFRAAHISAQTSQSYTGRPTSPIP